MAHTLIRRQNINTGTGFIGYRKSGTTCRFLENLFSWIQLTFVARRNCKLSRCYSNIRNLRLILGLFSIPSTRSWSCDRLYIGYPLS